MVVAGDSVGQLHFLDPRLPQPVTSTLVHKKGTKAGLPQPLVQPSLAGKQCAACLSARVALGPS